MVDINYHGPVVAFDLDDTLFRERDFCRSGFRYLCNPDVYKVPSVSPYPSDSELEDLAREMDRELSERRNPFSPFEEFFKPRIAEGSFDLTDHIQAYRNHLPDRLNFADGVPETFRELVRKGIRMALITDGRSGTQRRKIEALHLSDFISSDLIFISEETGFDKYSMEAFAHVVRAFPEASEFYYVGDNPRKDFYFPNLLGWTSVRVPYHPDNVHPQADPPSPLHEAHISVSNFSEILAIVS